MSNTTNDAEPFILFELAGTTYGVRSRFVQQMEMVEHITPVPNAPPSSKASCSRAGRSSRR